MKKTKKVPKFSFGGGITHVRPLPIKTKKPRKKKLSKHLDMHFTFYCLIYSIIFYVAILLLIKKLFF